MAGPRILQALQAKMRTKISLKEFREAWDKYKNIHRFGKEMNMSYHIVEGYIKVWNTAHPDDPIDHIKWTGSGRQQNREDFDLLLQSGTIAEYAQKSGKTMAQAKAYYRHYYNSGRCPQKKTK